MKHSLQRRAGRKRQMKLGTTVILWVSAVLFSVLLVVHLIYFSQISHMTRDALADKALAVARYAGGLPGNSPAYEAKADRERHSGDRRGGSQTQRYVIYRDYRYEEHSLFAPGSAANRPSRLKATTSWLALQGHENVRHQSRFSCQSAAGFHAHL